MNIKCVIFDLDGTLLYTLDDLAASTNYALIECGFKKRSVEEVRNFVGNGIKMLIERALGQNASEDNINRCLEKFIEHYRKNSTKLTRPYNGIIEVLDYLKTNGVKIGVNSNKINSAVAVLCQKFFKNYIDFALGETFEYGRKPDIAGVNKILSELGSKREEALFCGDSLVDLKTAKNADIPCISVSFGYCPKEILKANNPYFLADTPNELLGFFKENITNCNNMK